MKLPEFIKKKEYLVCVDSDGCAMDTMNIKHYLCFGPCMITEWELEEFKDEVADHWNSINLYTATRGINRFKALAKVLTHINERFRKIEDIEKLTEWTENSPELSNSALEKAVLSSPCSISLKKALNWSIEVNKAITLLPEEKKLPFPGVKEALAYAKQYADVAIVSSANPDAVIEEWKKHDLLEHTDIVLSQNDGSKAFCIGEMLKKGYDPKKVVMCGDAPGDLDAADKNGVYFFPILVNKEKESWEEFMRIGCDKLLCGEYGEKYQKTKKNEFYTNLGIKNEGV